MIDYIPSNAPTRRSLTVCMLHELGIPVHLSGYRQLRAAVPYYAENDTQSVTKELYPYLAKHFGYGDARAVEKAMRVAIAHGWTHGDQTVWSFYFPCLDKAPTNKQFIATLAEYLN